MLLVAAEETSAERLAVLNEPTVAVAGVDSVLQNVNVPAIDKVAVEPITCAVALSEHERMLVLVVPTVGELVNVVDHLKEQGDHVVWVRVRAGSVVIVLTLRISHMRLVVWRVFASIVARGEIDLSAEAIWTVIVGNSACLIRARHAQAHEADCGTRSSDGTSVVPLEWIPGHHAKAFGESMELFGGITGPLLVVDVHTAGGAIAFASLWDVFDAAILVHIVQLRRPVVGEVLLDWTGRARAVAGLIVVHGESESITTRDGVDVSGDLTRVDDGISALKCDPTAARHAPEGIGCPGHSGKYNSLCVHLVEMHDGLVLFEIVKLNLSILGADSRMKGMTRTAMYQKNVVQVSDLRRAAQG